VDIPVSPRSGLLIDGTRPHVSIAQRQGSDMYGVRIGAFCIDTGAHSGYTYRTIPTAVGLPICCRVEYFVSMIIQDQKFFFVRNTALNRLVADFSVCIIVIR